MPGLIALVLVLVGIGLIALVLVLRRRLGRLRLVIAPLAALLATLLIAAGGVLWWYHHRPLPPPVAERLFAGVEYARSVAAGPPPVIVHVVAVDLRTAGIGFLVTPPAPTGSRALAASITSRFLAEHGLQVAVNGDFFTPWHSRGPWDYYPHEGDPVDVRGLAVSGGRRYGLGETQHDMLFLTPGGEALIDPFPPEAGNLERQDANAISGGPVLVWDGTVTPAASTFRTAAERHPRTAVAVDRSGGRLLLIVVDGRQPNYSEGMTLLELAAAIVARGGWAALNLDGGGSTTLAVAGGNGRPRVLNSPIHTRIPGRERPVANHLGVRARPLGPGAGR